MVIALWTERFRWELPPIPLSFFTAPERKLESKRSEMIYQEQLLFRCMFLLYQHLNRMITCGMVAFGEFSGDNRSFEWANSPRVAIWLHLTASTAQLTNRYLHSPRELRIPPHRLSRQSENDISGGCEDLVLDAVFTIHNG
ncbi:MAG: hypothetical protein R3F11_22225 [Verrucomicrobiales bacterium]